MGDLKPGTVKELLIYEVLPKPINYSGAMSEMSSGGAFAVERLLARFQSRKTVQRILTAPARVPFSLSRLMKMVIALNVCIPLLRWRLAKE